MCRSVAEGGRRCPTCGKLTGAKLSEHNARRRKNRAIRSAVVSWARGNGVPETAVSVLAAAPPMVAKKWAADNGVPDALLELPPALPDGKSRISNARWIDADLVTSIARLSEQQGDHPEERRLLDAKVAFTEDVDEPGVNETQKVTFVGGQLGYFKPFTGLAGGIAEDFGQGRPLQPIHEAAAWQLARELGGRYSKLVPPCVIRTVDGQLGSLAADAGDPYGDIGDTPRGDKERAGFFDALIGQQDRHGFNYIVDFDDELHLIDHGFSFPDWHSQVNQTELQSARVRKASQLRAAERASLRKLLASPDLLGMDGVLEPSRCFALRVRATRMLYEDAVLDGGDFGTPYPYLWYKPRT